MYCLRTFKDQHYFVPKPHLIRNDNHKHGEGAPSILVKSEVLWRWYRSNSILPRGRIALTNWRDVVWKLLPACPGFRYKCCTYSSYPKPALHRFPLGKIRNFLSLTLLAIFSRRKVHSKWYWASFQKSLKLGIWIIPFSLLAQWNAPSSIFSHSAGELHLCHFTKRISRLEPFKKRTTHPKEEGLFWVPVVDFGGIGVLKNSVAVRLSSVWKSVSWAKKVAVLQQAPLQKLKRAMIAFSVCQ